MSDTEATPNIALLEALELLEHDLSRDFDSLEEISDEGRAWLETLCLLALEPEPIEVSDVMRQRLLGEVIGDQTLRVRRFAPASLRAPTPPPAAPPVSVQAPDPEVDLESTLPVGPAAARTERDTEVPPTAHSEAPVAASSPQPAPPVASGSRVWLALAAALAFVCLGLTWALLRSGGAVAAGTESLTAQVGQLEALQEQIERLQRQVELSEAELESLRHRWTQMSDSFGLVTSLTSEICPLRPPKQAPMPEARGVLFIDEQHQHWYLKLEQLAPQLDRIYHLWFLVGEDLVPVSGGTFELAVGREMELGSPTMPEDTRAVSITLETGETERPQGPVVLFGDEVMSVLG